MDSVGSENCVETATEQEYSHVQAVESFTPRKKLKQPDMSRTRWLGGGGSGGAAAGSLSLSLFWAACPRNPQGLLHLCLGDLRSDHTSKRARILIEKALGCQRSSLPVSGLDLIYGQLCWPFPKFWDDACCISWYGAGSLFWSLSCACSRKTLETRMCQGFRAVAHGTETIVRWQSQHLLETDQLQTAIQACFNKAKKTDCTAPIVKVMVDPDVVSWSAKTWRFREPIAYEATRGNMAIWAHRSRTMSTQIQSTGECAGRDRFRGWASWARYLAACFLWQRLAWNVKPEPIAPHQECFIC